jgi:hypothetical protein
MFSIPKESGHKLVTIVFMEFQGINECTQESIRVVLARKRDGWIISFVIRVIERSGY